MKNTTLSTLTVTAAGLLATASILSASPQHYGYGYSSTTLPKGAFELETGVTWSHTPSSNGFEFAHELEYGVTDKLQVSAMAEWEYAKADGEDSSAAFIKAGGEAIYQISNPNDSVVGSAILGEIAIGDSEFSIESKFILEKNFGPLNLTYNAGLEAFWTGSDYAERAGVFQQTLGAGTEITPNLFLGAMALHEVEFQDWSATGYNTVYLGPDISVRKGGFWTALAGLWQVTDDQDEADFQARLVVGYIF